MDMPLMIVAPIVFCVVVHSIAGAGDLKKVGRPGGKALVYFEVMTTVALIVGLALAYLFAPGAGTNINTASLDPHAMSTYVDNAHKLRGSGIGNFILPIPQHHTRHQFADVSEDRPSCDCSAAWPRITAD
jgi:aerobic C4-dicarboxylate transport protein